MLKSSFRPAGEAVAVIDPVRDVVHVRERARLLPGAEDLERLLARERLADEVRDGMRDPGLVVGHLARAIGVEGPADRERQAELVVGRAAVHLAGELRVAVGGARDGAVREVLLGRRKLLGPFEDHRRRHVREALDALVDRGLEDRVVEAAVDLGERERELVEVRDPADDRGQVDDVRAAGHRHMSLFQPAQVAGVDLARLAHPVGRRSLIRYADLPVGIAHEPAHDCGADRAGATGYENPVHGVSAATSAA